MHSVQFDLSSALGLRWANLYELLTSTDDRLEAHLAKLAAERGEAANPRLQPSASARELSSGGRTAARANDKEREPRVFS